MILVSDIVAAMRARLDDEGSQRYLFDQDYRPAINSAIDWMVTVYNYAFANTKLSEETLNDLLYTRIFQTSAYGEVVFNPTQLGHDVWTIAAVYAEPRTSPSTQPVVTTQDATSAYIPTRAFLGSKYRVRRKTIEQIAQVEASNFDAGCEALAGTDWREYAYAYIGRRSATGFLTGGAGIVIRPESLVNKKYVGVSYIKVPSKVQTDADIVEFPASVLDIFVAKAADYIAIKQGDQTTLHSLSMADAAQLVAMST